MPDADLDRFNADPVPEVLDALRACNAAPRFAADVAAGRPYASAEALVARAEEVSRSLDWSEVADALAGHPRIGDRVEGTSAEAAASRQEQSSMDDADAPVRAAIVAGNRAYEARFDTVFLIRAAGRSPAEMLGELRRRLENDELTERAEVVEQLAQITGLRVRALVIGGRRVSVSTHVLDSVTGRPAAGVAVALSAGDEVLAEGVTDADGRCRLVEGSTAAGTHRLVFDTGAWFAAAGRDTFYPEVVLAFTVTEPADHHHVPLLLSPFAYSTYRGS